MPHEAGRVLVVDDEPALRKALRTSLTASGFSVEEARNGDEALRRIEQTSFDIVLLDINMPGLSGVDACGRLRGLAPHIGIVMVTVRDAEDDKVRSLEAGADDYITKPFRLRELLARLRAVLRRVRTHDIAKNTPMRAGDLEMDFDRRLVRVRGEEVHLSPKEFELLAYMMRHQEAPLTHIKLLRSVWGPEYGNELEYLRSYVKMLRKKIEKNPATPEYILTEPWVGYRFRNPSDPDSPSFAAEED